MYRKRVQNLYPDLLSSMAAAPERRGEATEAAEGKGPAGTATMYGIQSKLWRRRGKATGSGGKQGDDWESGSHGSSSSYGSMSSFTGSWASSGFLEKSAVAPPLDAPQQELQGFRSKLRSFVASKRALLQDRAALGQQPKGQSWSAPEGTPSEAGEMHSSGLAEPGATGTLVSVKDVLETKVRDLGSDILEVPDLQAPNDGKGVGDIPSRPRSTATVKPGSPNGKLGVDTAGGDPGALRSDSEPQPQAQIPTSVQGGSERLEIDQGHGGSGGIGGGGSSGGGEPGLESAVSMFDVMVARLFFDLGFQDEMNKKFQEKLQVRAFSLVGDAAGNAICIGS